MFRLNIQECSSVFNANKLSTASKFKLKCNFIIPKKVKTYKNLTVFSLVKLK